MQATLLKLQAAYPELVYAPGEQFSWSPETQQIFYAKKAVAPTAIWSLLHETGHALLGHESYKNDFQLIRLEVAAWAKARELASNLGLEIDENHIQDCLDTYREWLYKRCLCPNCGTQCLQLVGQSAYSCHNCQTFWKVSASRFCRAYRSTKHFDAPEDNPQTAKIPAVA